MVRLSIVRRVVEWRMRQGYNKQRIFLNAVAKKVFETSGKMRVGCNLTCQILTRALFALFSTSSGVITCYYIK